MQEIILFIARHKKVLFFISPFFLARLLHPPQTKSCPPLFFLIAQKGCGVAYLHHCTSSRPPLLKKIKLCAKTCGVVNPHHCTSSWRYPHSILNKFWIWCKKDAAYALCILIIAYHRAPPHFILNIFWIMHKNRCSVVKKICGMAQKNCGVAHIHAVAHFRHLSTPLKNYH